MQIPAAFYSTTVTELPSPQCAWIPFTPPGFAMPNVLLTCSSPGRSTKPGLKVL